MERSLPLTAGPAVRAPTFAVWLTVTIGFLRSDRSAFGPFLDRAVRLLDVAVLEGSSFKRASVRGDPRRTD
jgi:hypothetical protein